MKQIIFFWRVFAISKSIGKIIIVGLTNKPQTIDDFSAKYLCP
jgi:hypothetical protein